MYLVSGALFYSSQFTDQIGTNRGAQPISVALIFEISSASVVAQSIVAQNAMSIEEQKLLCRFMRLTLSRFFGPSSEDEFKFLIVCKDKLRNYGLVETHGAGYATFQLDTTT